MRGVEDLFHRRGAMALLALDDIALGKIQIIKDRLGIGPLLEQIVVLEEMIVPEGGVRHHQGLHGHGVFFHVVAYAGVGIDYEFVCEAHVALAVQLLLADEVLAERPMLIHQRHADRRIGVQHLLGGNDIDLIWI